MICLVRFTFIAALIQIKYIGVGQSSGVAGSKNNYVGPEVRSSASEWATEATEIEDVTNISSEDKEEASWVDMRNKWLEGINPWTDAADCCIGFQNKDCNGNCDVLSPICNLECGFLLLPTTSIPGEVLGTLFTAKTGARINFTVSVSDLRPWDSITVYNNQGDRPLEIITCDSFSKEHMKKYFVSDAETFYVAYESTSSTEGKGCGGLEEPTGKLEFNTIKKVECHVPILEDADGKLYGDIVSPGFPSLPYPSLRDCTWTIQAPSPGFGIELQVETFSLDGTYGDYIQVNAGSVTSKNRGHIMTWSTTKSQHVFKIYSGGSATIYFHSGLHMSPNTFNGFHIIYKHFGNESQPGSTTTSGPEIPTPSQGHDANYTLYIAGKTPEEFNNDKDSFKDSMVVIANVFSQAEHIDLIEPISFQDVIIHSILHCPPTWPNSQSCTEVIIQIVARTTSGEYQLTDSNLGKMWKKYGWDRNVTHTGITPYEKNEVAFTWWLVGASSVLILFIIILLAAWCFQSNPRNSSPQNKAKKTSENEKTTGTARFEYPKSPFRPIEEDEVDDIDSYISNQRDSYDYEGSTTYFNYDDSTITEGKINPAFNNDDEEDMDEVNLGAEDFKFQFVDTQLHGRSRLERSFKILTDTNTTNSETPL